MIRVLVVEDSLTIRMRLCDVLSNDPSIEVVGDVGDGKAAIEMCERLRPDAITMDMMLPLMTGLAATEYIMAHFPTPILVVSASFNRGELFRTYDALAAGAVDVLDKPTGDEPDGEWERALIAAVKMVARIPVMTHPMARLNAIDAIRAERNGHPAPHATQVDDLRGECSLIAIGASTGGPGAIVEVLRALPYNSATPILFVLHIGESFASAFASWLDNQTPWPVACARGGERISDGLGRVMMAPPGHHLVVRDGRLELSDAPERHSCRPSIDVLFESVAREYGSRSAACLLTGMGRDGAAGLRTIRDAGGLTIAQDESTSVVYGMPREAAELNAASHILPVGEIGRALANLVAVPSETSK